MCRRGAPGAPSPRNSRAPLDKRATLLPRILPLGGLEERETAELFGGDFDFDDELPPAIEELERRFLLAQLVAQWSRAVGHAIVSIYPDGVIDLDRSEPFLVASSPSGAYALAADLGALIDEFIIEDVAASAIGGIVDDAFDQYWSITTTFLSIALEQWPRILRERGQTDTAARQKRIVEAQIARFAEHPAHPPVIALGSTGAQPTTARLLAAIAALQNGAVVLPGLDGEMSEAAWAHVGARDEEPAFTHPQSVLKRLLGVMRLERDDVRELGRVSAQLAARRSLVAQAMLPPDATAAWRSFRNEKASIFSAALEDICVLEAPDEGAEAVALALFMREALETPGRTAALVTPDRTIARRVAVELRRFGLEIDDSGGNSLASTGAGALARQAAAIGAEGLNAVNIAALLAHPLTRLGRTRGEIQALAPLVEIGVLRALPVRADGYGGLLEAARAAARSTHAHPAARRITQAQWKRDRRNAHGAGQRLRAFSRAVRAM